MGTAVKHPMTAQVEGLTVKPSFVVFDIRALWRSAMSARVPGCQILQMTTRSGTRCFIAVDLPIWHSGRQMVSILPLIMTAVGCAKQSIKCAWKCLLVHVSRTLWLFCRRTVSWKFNKGK